MTRLGYACQIWARTMATSRNEAAAKKRQVAGSFLFKIPNGDHTRAKVALFRRSDKVRTYKGKLAPCSGSVESSDAGPLATALREISEETSLQESSLSLLRVGKPYTFADRSIGREWSINPFAFRIKDASEGGVGEEGIKLDWEHDGVEWFDPMQVKGSDEFGGVPRLIDSLRRVWPEYNLGPQAGQVLTKGLQILRDNHQHGARELATTAVETLRDVILQLGKAPIDEAWWWNIRMAAWHICQARPSMNSAITSSITKALGKIHGIYKAETIEDKVREMTESLSQQLDERNTMSDRICLSFFDYIRSEILPPDPTERGISILTLSLSSTISRTIQLVASRLGIPIDLRVLESRPLFEGVTLAAKLLQEKLPESKLKVTVYSDASVALAARDVDVLLLGADRLSSTGDVDNKIGSLPAVLSARYVAFGAKVVVASDTEKIAGPGSTDEHKSEENDPSELTQAWKGTAGAPEVIENALLHDDPKVTIKNTYFEWVPAKYIDAYATDEGIWNAVQIQDRSARVANEAIRYFEDL
ncbi:translation initiation factor eIF-2B subunit family protein [Xylaria sp. CBS 124048]|nr:translation initiation factor eIF-2B subunit family protein [Xylaria sp. CBS 124048]